MRAKEASRGGLVSSKRDQKLGKHAPFCPEGVRARVNESVLTVFLRAVLRPQTDGTHLDGCFPQQVSRYGAEDG